MRHLRPSPRLLVAVTVVFGLADWASRVAGDSVVPGGPLDETAHLLTTLIVLWALGRRICDRFLVPALVASVAIDVDHVPGALGDDVLTRGTPRRSRRDVLLGVAIGLTIHFWRDMAESDTGVSLAWPVSDHRYVLSHTGYLLAMAVFVIVAAVRSRPPARRPACVES